MTFAYKAIAEIIYNVQIDVPYEKNVWKTYYLSIPCFAGLSIQFLFPNTSKIAMIIIKWLAPIKIILAISWFLMPYIDLFLYKLLTFAVSLNNFKT